MLFSLFFFASFRGGKMFASLKKKIAPNCIITGIEVTDVRFPTSYETDISDAVHTSPDFSSPHVIISAEGVGHIGQGWSFTLGKGSEVVVAAMNSLSPLVVGKSLLSIYTDFRSFWHDLVGDSQLRWIGPEKGAVHLAAAGIINALWDLWGKIEGKPVWNLLSDMSPEEIVSLVDFTYVTDVITEQEALDMLRRNRPTKDQRVDDLRDKGYPAYITSIGWLNIDKDQLRTGCREALDAGFTRFKMKVGLELEEDAERCRIIREEIGMDCPLMMDVNQKWDVQTAIDHMTGLAEYKPFWIEEPTSCDDILGHAKIARALKKLNIGVATGECCHNRVMFKQFIEHGGMDYCQIDCCRLGGVNEIIAILFIAAKFGIPVCPHCPGGTLSELTQHIVFFDYIYVSTSLDNRMIEYSDHLREHMLHPVDVRGGRYYPLDVPGYGQIKEESVAQFKYPTGPVWQKILNK